MLARCHLLNPYSVHSMSFILHRFWIFAELCTDHSKVASVMTCNWEGINISSSFGPSFKPQIHFEHDNKETFPFDHLNYEHDQNWSQLDTNKLLPSQPFQTRATDKESFPFDDINFEYDYHYFFLLLNCGLIFYCLIILDCSFLL